MAREGLILTLGKVLIAAAWADGEITGEEKNCLKDLLFRLPEVSARDWAALEIYLDHPVGEEERGRLVAELISQISRPSEKDLALKKRCLLPLHLQPHLNQERPSDLTPKMLKTK